MKANKYLTAIYGKKHTGIDYQNDFQEYIDSLKIERVNPIRIVVYVGVVSVGYWRAFTPFMELAKNPHYDIRITGALNSNLNDWADIIYLERAVNRDILEEVKLALEAGKRVIFDTDDYLHGLPIKHPNKKDIENGTYLPDMDELIKLCGEMTVSTPYLKTIYQKKYPKANIYVLPNYLQPDDWKIKAPAVKETFGTVNIGWSGSATHFEDIRQISIVIKDLMDEFKDVRLLTMNYNGIEKGKSGNVSWYRDAFEEIPHEKRIEFVGTDHVHIIQKYTQFIDIGIAPLEINEFNKCKSNVKYLEYSATKIPTIATDIEPYNGDTAILVKNNRYDNWYKELKNMICNKKERGEAGELAYQNVMEKYCIDDNINKWEEVFYK